MRLQPIVYAELCLKIVTWLTAIVNSPCHSYTWKRDGSPPLWVGKTIVSQCIPKFLFRKLGGFKE